MKTMHQPGLPASQGRRDVLLGAAAAATTLAAGTVFAATEHHHKMDGNPGLVDAALDCVKKSQACNAHCIELVKSGDTSIADCMKSVSETLAACTALSQLASSHSAHLPAFAKVCISICSDCEKECRKHEDKHAECKACADSCRNCIDACKKVAA
jgi:Cys-rich four helix bundle protein (predicted Tat secretion target)